MKFYAIQIFVAGFGHDTSTVICFQTYEEAEKWVNSAEGKEYITGEFFEIVEQTFGETYNKAFG